MSAKLTLNDIADLRAYEREREEFRNRVIALKRVRLVQVGPIVSIVFENRDTVRFQVQEMARAERMLFDEQIQTELDIYNPLIPERGELSATLFIEIGTKSALMEWLPKLVGIERSVELRIGEGNHTSVVPSMPEEEHESHLTRDDVTASVHYLRFRLAEQQIQRFATEPVHVAVVHPHYAHETGLSGEIKASLLEDLRGP